MTHDRERSEPRTFRTEHSPRRLRLTLGYRGTRYAGWARQPAARSGGRPTLQATVEAALARVVGHPVGVTVAGRTDAGVHADAQVVSFDTTCPIPPAGLVRALAEHLPPDIWALDAAEAPATFDARRGALRRWYRYAVWRGHVPPTAWRGRSLVHPGPLDLGAMRAAARGLLGRRDFAALAGGWGGDGRPGRGTTRVLFAADWLEPAPSISPLLLFEVCGTAFLRQMIRAMVGGLLWVGEGKWSPEDFATALAAADRRRMGPTAPAEGLTLWRIEYP